MGKRFISLALLYYGELSELKSLGSGAEYSLEKKRNNNSSCMFSALIPDPSFPYVCPDPHTVLIIMYTVLCYPVTFLWYPSRPLCAGLTAGFHAPQLTTVSVLASRL